MRLSPEVAVSQPTQDRGRFHIICQHGTRVLIHDQCQDRFSVITFPDTWPNSHDNPYDALGEFNSYFAE